MCGTYAGTLSCCLRSAKDPGSAYAAKDGVIASVERIVSESVIDDCAANHVIIPGQRVRGLCEAPRGAHPQALRTGGLAGIERYVDDYAFLADVAQRCATRSDAARWYADWVRQPGGHAGYLERLRERGLPAVPAGVDSQPMSDAERVTILTCRAIVELVRTRGYDTLFAGIGNSHPAAWLAAAVLRADGIPVRVCAELGFDGHHREPGDAFLFSQSHADRCEALTSVAESLGGMVGGNRGRTLGVLSAAEVDPEGNLNTTRLANGSWLTGSGGANDIASTTDCVVAVAASPRRYVTRVAHITCPGMRIREVVSQFGRFPAPPQWRAPGISHLAGPGTRHRCGNRCRTTHLVAGTDQSGHHGARHHGQRTGPAPLIRPGGSLPVIPVQGRTIMRDGIWAGSASGLPDSATTIHASSLPANPSRPPIWRAQPTRSRRRRTVATMAANAIRQALSAASMPATDLDLLLLANCTTRRYFPKPRRMIALELAQTAPWPSTCAVPAGFRPRRTPGGVAPDHLAVALRGLVASEQFSRRTRPGSRSSWWSATRRER